MKTLIVILIALVCMAQTFRTPTYYTQRTLDSGDIMASVSGSLDFVYNTGGVTWRDPYKKFKTLWGIKFEDITWPAGARYYLAAYNRDDKKIIVFDIATQAEIADNTIVTETYFEMKGQR